MVEEEIKVIMIFATMKFECVVVGLYENISDKFDNGHCQIKVKFTLFTTIQTIRSYNSTLIEARKPISSKYVHLIIIHNIYEYRHP